jgi:hypothetical protein
LTNVARKQLEKPKRYRNNAYLDFVRAHHCISCGADPPNFAHHARRLDPGRPTQSKVSDYNAVPLCAACHSLEHEGIGMDLLEMYKWAFAILRAWAENNGNNTRSV